jgi:hypothetical protein
MDADFARNRLVTSDFVNPVTTLNVFPGAPELSSSLRFWDLAAAGSRGRSFSRRRRDDGREAHPRRPARAG